MRAVIFFALLIAIQGVLAALLPHSIVAPDLFLLAALAVSTRLRPSLGLLAAYGIGLIQDVIGAGWFGFHALAIASAIYASYGARRFFSGNSWLNQATIVLVAVAIKWITYLLFDYWTRAGLMTSTALVSAFLPELLTTLLCAPLVHTFARWAFGNSSFLKDDRLL